MVQRWSLLSRPAASTVRSTRRDHVLGPAAPPSRSSSTAATPARTAGPPTSASPRCATEFGDRLRYVFRHRPLDRQRASRAGPPSWPSAPRPRGASGDAHVTLMTRSATLTEDDLDAVAARPGLPPRATPAADDARGAGGAQRVEADIASARASGVLVTPTFFINGRRYDGPWDESSLADAMLGSLGHRVRIGRARLRALGALHRPAAAGRDAAAVVLTNSPSGPAFDAFWEQPLGVTLRRAAAFAHDRCSTGSTTAC